MQASPFVPQLESAQKMIGQFLTITQNSFVFLQRTKVNAKSLFLQYSEEHIVLEQEQ